MNVHQPQTPAEGAKILVVDDVPKNIQVLGIALRAEGWQVIPATSGAQALAAAQRHNPDLILLDVMMPEMDGRAVIAELKKNEATRDIPVIFVTALTDEEDEERCLELGGVDYITKPVKILPALARVRIHLALREANKRLAEQNAQLIEAANLREDIERIARHDLKNPLSVILTAPVLLEQSDNLYSMQKQIIETIKRAGYRMLHMINHSLDLYKMETKVYELKPEVVDILKVLEVVMEETRPLASAKSVTLRLLVDGRVPEEGESFEASGEEMLCYSMLGNLIKNAVEASPKGETVEVSLENDEQKLIRIHNAGAVSRDIRDRFFEKYATSGKERGTGLGTYSAKLIAETQGGSVCFDSSEKDGTTLVVRMPRARAVVS